MKKLEKQAKVMLVTLGVMAAGVSEADLIELKPGGSHRVTEHSPVDEFDMIGARLRVENNGVTGRIRADEGSRVDITGGRVIATGETAINLNNSHAVIDGGTIIGNANPSRPDDTAYAMRVSGNSSAQISNSFLSGVGRGIAVNGRSTLELFNTEVEGHAGGRDAFPGGVGVSLAGARAAFMDGSKVSGDQNGVVMFAYTGGSARLAIDQSSVIGRTGSAILVAHRATSDEAVEIVIRNGSTLTGGNGIILEVEKDATANVNVSNSHLTGDVQVHDGATAHLDLNSRASLTGTITNATSLSIDDSSLWIMQGDSSVGELKLDGGMVDLRGTDGNASFHQLDLKELSGNGTFALGTDLAAGTGDSLNISDKATGTHKLRVENTGAEPMANGADRQLVRIENGDAQFSVDSKDGLVDAGAYSYELEERSNGSGKDWHLVQTGKMSKSTEVAIGLFSAAPTVWYGESSTLRSRMGELRTDSQQGGGWIRTYGNKHTMSASGGLAYSQRQHGISFGADMPVSASGQWLIGLTGGYSKSDLDLKAGNDGTVDSFHVGAYSTWMADDGLYIDALIKANRFQNKADVTMRDGGKSKGDYSTHGVGASVEIGKHIKLKDDWFVEPYAQASALWVSGEDYTLDNGLKARSNNTDSLLGKVGSHIGRQIPLKDGGFVKPYVKAAVAREFSTSNSVKVNDTRFTNDLSGTRGELGLGIAAQLTDVLQVHADFDYMKGEKIEQPWGVNVGLRYNW